MKITIAQISLEISLPENLHKILEIIRSNIDSDLIVFPELALTSYDFDYLSSLDQQKIDTALKKIQGSLSSGDQIIIAGTIRYDHNLHRFNSAAVIKAQKINFYDKKTLTLQDKAVFSPGKNILIFNHNNFRIGLMICRDQNNIIFLQRYKGKTDLMVQLSAHYYEPEIALKKLDKNIAMPIVRAMDIGVPFIKVNTVGKLNSKISLGSSIFANKQGMILRKASRFIEEIITFNLEEEL